MQDGKEFFFLNLKIVSHNLAFYHLAWDKKKLINYRSLIKKKKIIINLWHFHVYTERECMLLINFTVITTMNPSPGVIQNKKRDIFFKRKENYIVWQYEGLILVKDYWENNVFFATESIFQKDFLMPLQNN